jgi:pimeloyl-ACP methyl ester carboxylesterase
MVGANDLVTIGIAAGSVHNQPQLEVEVVPDVGHWLPEQRPELILRWVGDA